MCFEDLHQGLNAAVFDGIGDELTVLFRLDQSPGETAGLGARLAAGAAASFRGLVQGGQELLVWLSYHLVLVAVFLAAAVGAWYGYRLRKRRKDKPNP